MQPRITETTPGERRTMGGVSVRVPEGWSSELPRARECWRLNCQRPVGNRFPSAVLSSYGAVGSLEVFHRTGNEAVQESNVRLLSTGPTTLLGAPAMITVEDVPGGTGTRRMRIEAVVDVEGFTLLCMGDPARFEYVESACEILRSSARLAR